MADDDERLIAMQRAYAEVILNTSREAAERVMAAEQRAQETRDEALRMLVRLKKMMDAKAAEAELMAKNQQDKIDLLEAQLQEGEDIVKDLREELRETQSELERMRKEKQSLNVQNGSQYTSSAAFPSNGGEYSANNVMRTEFQRNENLRLYTPAPISNLYSGTPQVPSILSRSKVSDLYRLGYAPIILASEGKLMENSVPSYNRFGNKFLSSFTSSPDEISCSAAEVSNKASHLISVRSDADVNLSSVLKLSKNTTRRGFETTGNGKAPADEREVEASAGLPDLVNGVTGQISWTDQADEVSNTISHPISADVDLSIGLGLSAATTEYGLKTAGDAEATRSISELTGSAGVDGVTELVPTQTLSLPINTTECGLETKGDGKAPINESELKGSDTVDGVTESAPISVDTSEAEQLEPAVAGDPRLIRFTFQRKRKRGYSDGDAASKRP